MFASQPILMKLLPVGILGILGILLASLDASFDEARAAVEASPPTRNVMEFDAKWRFSKGDFAAATAPGFDDSTWRHVDLPHDWSSEGPFSADYASGNGYAPGGIGWYRKHFKLDAADTNKLVAVEFDGVYDHSEVWLNGHFVGGRPYGYSSFECVLTRLARFGADNVLAVRVDHSRFADSRWYTGSGIYRHVRLRLTEKLRVAHWGTYVTTPEVAPEAATVRVETGVENGTGRDQPYSLHTELLAPDGRVVAGDTASGTLATGTNQTVVQRITLPSPRLWSPALPILYSAKSRLSGADALLDETSTLFGIRVLRFDPDRGFFLNGSSIKIKGVCIHHDAGCLGSAVPERVLERRLLDLEGTGRQRHPHQPQPARSRVARPMRPPRVLGHGRGF